MPSVKFDVNIVVNGQNVVARVSAEAKDLAKNLDAAAAERQGFRDMQLMFNQIGQSFQNLTKGLQQLTGVMQTYTAAYNAQEEAESRLLTVMRQRMGATEDDLRAIMDLTSAQQKLGVVGDEVQLMGAQQIATFANQRQTLETLIPAMNNLLVHQKGLKATGQDAVGIANLIGKALQGNVTALTKVGITMSDAEKNIIKLGTETERAAAIARIITNNVGEMNAEMAKTDAGKAQQLSNTIGDIKEQVGALFSKFEPLIVAVGEVGLAFNGFMTAASAVASLTSVIKNLHAAHLTASVSAKAHSVTLLLLTKVMRATGVSANVLKLSLRGLMIATGVGAAIAALAFLIYKLAGSSDNAAKKAGDAEGEKKSQ